MSLPALTSANAVVAYNFHRYQGRLEKSKPLCFVLDGPRIIVFNVAKNQSARTACTFDATLQLVSVWNRGARMHYRIRSTKSCYALHSIALAVLIISPLSRLRVRVAGGSTFSGKVTDTTGTTIPHAQVSVKNVSTGLGLATLIRTGITLTVGAQQVLNFTLRVGQMNERIEVIGEATTVELASASENVNETAMRELLRNGRDWTQLATLERAAGIHSPSCEYVSITTKC